MDISTSANFLDKGIEIHKALLIQYIYVTTTKNLNENKYDNNICEKYQD